MDERLSSSPARPQGLDVSDFQGTIRWDQVAKAGKVFAFIKATEGTTLVDRQFRTNWEAAKAAGLLRGAYHFFRSEEDPKWQAESFLHIVQAEPGELPPVLDIEKGEASEVIQGIQTWLDTVKQAAGVSPILYTNPSFWNGLGVSDFGNHPLWIAEYGVESPKGTNGWPTWTFWQYSDSGSVPGIATHVDLDVFQGTCQELQQMCRSGA